MSTRIKKNTEMSRWMNVEELLQKEMGSFLGLTEDVNKFLEIRVKLREDGTYLAIVKAVGEDGSGIVCFGVGYSYVLALLAVEKTIAGDHWKVDKPWNPKK